jgi:hypothetical protein
VYKRQRQELVFIGIGMDEIELYDSLQSCLLTDEEVSRGIEAWLKLDDAFPQWNIQLEDVFPGRTYRLRRGQ